MDEQTSPDASMNPPAMSTAVDAQARDALLNHHEPTRRPGDGPWVWGWFFALLAFTSIMVFYHLDGGAEFEPTDCWVAQTAREMSEANDWLVPRFSGETRLQKSPGPYWAVMLTALLRGEPVDPIAARIPNGIAALIIVLTIFYTTRKIGGDRAAVFASFAASSSTLILYWSHRGASDLGLAAFITVSLCSLWLACGHEPPGRKRVALLMLGYLTAGLGMLYKMPMPLPLIGVPAFLYLLLRNRWRVLASPWHLLGWVLFLLPWLPWAVAIYLTEPTAVAKWRLEFWDRFTGDLPNVQEQKQWQFYFMYLLPTVVYTIPYTLSVPAAFVRAFRRQTHVNRDGTLFMVIWFVGHFAFFTAAVGKETRYFLPALPPLFVLLGCELSVLFDPDRPTSRAKDRLAALAVYLLVPLGFGAGTFGLYRWHTHDGLFEWSQVWPPYVGLALIFTLGAWLAVTLYVKGKRNGAFGALVGTMWLAWLWIWPTMMPILASEGAFIDFAAQLRDKLPAEYRDDLKQIGSQDARIIWYSDVRFPRIIDQLVLLEMEGGQRSIAEEERLIGGEMVRQLAGDEPVLFVASRPHYVEFMMRAPRELARKGQPFPASYLWLQTDPGPKPYKHFIVFGNKPPPWPEPTLTPPSERLNQARARWAEERATSKPSGSAPVPSGTFGAGDLPTPEASATAPGD